MPSFCNQWKEEVCMQLLAKASQWLKDVKGLDRIAYSKFIVVFVGIEEIDVNSFLHFSSLYHSFLMFFFFSHVQKFLYI